MVDGRNVEAQGMRLTIERRLHSDLGNPSAHLPRKLPQRQASSSQVNLTLKGERPGIRHHEIPIANPPIPHAAMFSQSIMRASVCPHALAHARKTSANKRTRAAPISRPCRPPAEHHHPAPHLCRLRRCQGYIDPKPHTELTTPNQRLTTTLAFTQPTSSRTCTSRS